MAEESKDSRRYEAKVTEYTALRAEILNHSTAQSALVGVGLTAVGVLLGFIFKDDNNHSLAYAIPFLCFALTLLHTSYEMKIYRIGAYLRHTLWPAIIDDIPGSIPSWELERPRPRRGHLIILLFDWTAAGLFALASTLSLVSTSVTSVTFGIVGWILTALTLTAPELARYINRQMDPHVRSA